MKHHPFGGSKLGLRARCPASYAVSEGVEDSGSDPAAAKGSLIHRLLAGSSEPRDGLTEWDLELVARGERYLEQARETVGDVPGLEILKEERLGPLELEGVPEEFWPFATADVVIQAGSAAAIVDYKAGPLEIDEGLSAPQLFEEAVMLMDRKPEIERCACLIYHLQSDTEFSVRVTRAELPALRSRIREIIMRALDPLAPFFASPSGCARCAGSHQCPAAVGLMMRYDQKKVRRLEELAPAAISSLYAQADLVEKMAHNVKAAIVERAVKGHPVPGYRLREQRRRVVTNAFGAFQIAEIGLAAFLGCCRVSVTAFEKLFAEIWSEKHRTTKARGKVEFADKLKKCITLSEPSRWLERQYKRREITDDS